VSGFAHDIAGGGGELIIPSLYSPDYVPGVSGWAIFKNGNVEFNNGTFRGTILAATIIGALIQSSSELPRLQMTAAGNFMAFAADGTQVFRWDLTQEGVFIYADSGGSGVQGALIGSWSAKAGTDGLTGTAYPQGLNVTAGTISGATFKGTDFIINSAGAFFYNGAPALGNMIASIASAAGADSFGNAFGDGFTSYLAPAAFIKMVDGGVSYHQSGFDAGIGSNSLNSGAMTFGMFATDGVNTHISGFDLAPQASPQMVMRLGNIIVACDPATAVGATSIPETWHDLRPLQNSFTVPTGDYAPQCRLGADGYVEIWGTVTLPATTYAAITFATLPAGYRPLHTTQRYPIAFQAGGTPGSARVQIGTTGNMSLQGLPTGGSGTDVWIGGRFPLESTGLITT
jgi:hypothetical protein